MIRHKRNIPWIAGYCGKDRSFRASAMLSEAALSFLGAGTPPDRIPSRGTMMADGRSYLSSATWIIMFPGLFLAATFLSVNLVGDGLRDLLDPRFAKEV